MFYLIGASFLWAFSFGLIKGQLAGLDPVAVAGGRLALAAAAFAPALLRSRVPRGAIGFALALGAVQFGLMYVLYIAAFGWLPAWKVALFTVFTPLLVILLADLRDRRFRARSLAAAVLAVLGAMWAQGTVAGGDWRGILLLQGANLCFAFGQVAFPRLVRSAPGRERGLVAWMYLGAFLVTAVALIGRGPTALAGWRTESLLVLLYLGVVPTAVGFYLWNKGAVRTSVGFLAGANNLKVPLAVVVAWTVFGEEAAYGRALLGLAVVVLALFLARPNPVLQPPPADPAPGCSDPKG